MNSFEMTPEQIEQVLAFFMGWQTSDMEGRVVIGNDPCRSLDWNTLMPIALELGHLQTKDHDLALFGKWTSSVIGGKPSAEKLALAIIHILFDLYISDYDQSHSCKCCGFVKDADGCNC